jgi:hypothetical protein
MYIYIYFNTNHRIMRNPVLKLLTILAIVVTFLAGCISKPCSLSHLTPAFIDFSQDDLDTIMVRRYEANGNFNHLLDTLVVTKNEWYIKSSADTTIIETNLLTGAEGAQSHLVPGYDWEIYIPGVKKSILISHIVFEQTEKRAFILNDLWGCQSPITSYVQDGQQIMAQLFSGASYDYGGGPFHGYLIYIHK